MISDTLRIACHVQDQFLRYLLKSRPWPLAGVQGLALNPFDVRVVADLLAALRAESRHRGEEVDPFLARLTTPAGLAELLADVTAALWRDRRLTDDQDFRDRLVATLTAPGALGHLRELFGRVRNRAEVSGYVMDVLVHSLRQAMTHLFLVEGSAQDEVVGSHAMLGLTHDRRPIDPAFYVYERNQDGNGATRLVGAALTERTPSHVLARWWDASLACPVEDEEDFVKHVLRRHHDSLRRFQQEFWAAPPEARPSPRGLVVGLAAPWLSENDPRLGRLAGLLTGELIFAGRRLRQLDLALELLGLEDELARRFHRPAVPAELAGYAATAAEQRPAAVPRLRELYEVYRAHAAAMGLEEDVETAAHPLDRFLAQVEHLSLSTCVDACPACLAAGPGPGEVEVGRHALSRCLLWRAHRLLTRPFTRPYGDGSPEELVRLARGHAGYLILEQQGPADPDFLRALRHAGFEEVGRFAEFPGAAGPLVRHVLVLRGQS
jgi:hypothetical protein